jgi:hypothetical protein
VHAASGAIVNTNRNELVSAHLSARGQSIIKISGYSQSATSECEPSPGRLTTCPQWFAMRHLDHLAELSEDRCPFCNDRISRGVANFRVSRCHGESLHLIHPSKYRSATLCISTVRILKAEHNAITFTPFSQKEFDDDPLLLLDVHCHFSGSTI